MKLPVRAKRILRWGLLSTAILLGAIAFLTLVWWRGALYNRWIRFPRQAAAWAAIRAGRVPVSEEVGWKEYRGVLHSHSHLSHDSEVPFEEILNALKQTGRDFIALSDHCTDGRADFNRQWRGLHDGKLFIPGFEMKEGIMPFGVRSGTVLSNQSDLAVLAGQIVANGGLLFYAHPEEPRAWEQPELTGMEIYNIHADLKDEKGALLGLLPDLLLNYRSYPEQVLRTIFDRPEANLRTWDALNRTRHLTGIAGNDCHQNTGLRLLCLGPDELRLEDTSPKTIAKIRLNVLTRGLAKMVFGPLTPGRQLFRLQLDPYERMVRFVTTHVLARELTETSILESLKAGRVFVGFDLIADSTGFIWMAQNGSARAVLGEALPWSGEVRLHAAAPYTCRVTVLRDGAPVHRLIGSKLDWAPPGPGVYRVEAELEIEKEWVPWVYTNPIWLR